MKLPRICVLYHASPFGKFYLKAFEEEFRLALLPPSPERARTYAEAAAVLGCSVRTVVRYARELGLAPGKGARGGRKCSI